MTTISCPRCGAGFPLESVAAFERFTCGACGEEVPVPTTAPLPSVPHAGRGSPRARPAAAHAADADAHPHLRHAARHPAAPRKRPFPVAAAASAGLLVVGAVGWWVLRDDGGDVSPSESGGSATTSAGTTASAPSSDPERDPAAWRALPEPDRQSRTSTRMMQLDPRDASAGRVLHEFFVERGEAAAAERVANVILGASPDARWAREALGHSELSEKIEATLRECPRADMNDTDALLRLRAFRRRHAPEKGAWWGDTETRAKVEALLVELRADEARLRTPFGQAVADWVSYHRSIDVMRDYPAVHGTVGPYLVFVSLPVHEPEPAEGASDGAEETRSRAREPARRDVTLDDVKPEDLERGKAILDRTLKMYADFYEGWHRELGPVFGFSKYGPENTDRECVLLVNVFTSWEDYATYNARAAGFSGARAYYSLQEPRMITTYDGPVFRRRPAGPQPEAEESEDDAFAEDTAQIQFHEGTHQLVHFYTWDLTRKATGKRLGWLDCDPQRSWSAEGFAEFFSSYKEVDGVRKWMQPLDERMCHIWMFGEVLRERGWDDWRLSEVLDPIHAGQLEAIAETRGKPAERGLAGSIMTNLFYAKAWSLNYFLWHCEDGGKPKYRDRFIGYLKKELLVETTRGKDGVVSGRKRTPAEFREAFDLRDDAAFAAFDREWKEYEAKLVAAHHQPSWDKQRARLRKFLPPK